MLGSEDICGGAQELSIAADCSVCIIDCFKFAFFFFF